MRLILAFRVFFQTLLNAATATRVEQLLSGTTPSETAPPPREPEPAAVPKAPPVPRPPARSEALTLLATLQREARFVDFIKEALDGYSDAQIGAAARDVHCDCGKVLERLFALRPVLAGEEGTNVEVGAEPERFHLLGRVTGSPPFRGTLVHAGWEATHCELPTWTGSDSAAKIVAPAEVEIT